MLSSLTESETILQNIVDSNNIKICLFVEDIEEYIEIDNMKIDINEQSRECYYDNSSINICCQLNKNTIIHALHTLKYNKLMYEETSKSDIVSDAIIYVSLNDELIKVIEFKNLMILSYNEYEYDIQLTCDHYIMFSDIQSIKNEQYLRSIYNKLDINISYNNSYKPWNSINVNNHDNCNEDNYWEDDWDDYDYDYDDEDNDQHNTFEKSSNLISKIFSEFY